MRSNLLSFCVLAFLLFSTSGRAQNYYPGGLGNTNLKIWLNAGIAASLTYNGSNQVSQWSDLSGNAYHFVQASTANKPVYNTTAGPSSLPGIVFTRANSQYLSTASLPASISFAGGLSTLSVLKFTSTGNFERLYDFGNGTANNNILAGRFGTQANFFYEGWNGGSGGQVYTTSSPVVNGTANMYEFVQQGGTPGNNTAVAFYSAGAAQTVSGSLGSAISPLPAAVNRTANYIARSNWAGDAYFEGAVSELLVFNTALNTTQRSILQDYLSAAWGMPVSPSYFTPPAAATFNKNLVGIGYTSVSDNWLSNPAGSTDGLGFSSGTTASDFLNSAGFLMAAHNGQANTLLTGINITGISTTNINRLNRSWFLHRSSGNSAGTVTVGFSFGDYNGSSLPAGAISYGLLYNATSSNFSTGTNVLLTRNFTTGGSNVNFAVSASSLADGYYSLVWSTSFVLPVKLANFAAQQHGTAVVLAWQTAAQLNLRHFDIERSIDGSSFSSIGMVAGTGNSTSTTAYQFTDKQPAPGLNYYRLRMVDLDGSTSYTATKTIVFSGKRGFTVYPNPAGGTITIQPVAFTGPVQLQIVNSIGQPVFKASKTLSGALLLPVDFLAKGVYYLQASAGTENFTVRFVKE